MSKKSPKLATIRVSIGEITELIDYHEKIASALLKIPLPSFQAVNEHRTRRAELIEVLDTTWPK